MKAVLMHSDFVVGDDDSMSESEGAEPAMALYARQQIDAAAALYDMPRQGPSRPDSVAPSPAMRRPPIMVTARRPPPELGPSAEEEAMAGEAQEFAEETHAANERARAEVMAAQGVQGAVEPPADHIPVQDFIDNGTFDEVLHDLASQNFEAMLDPPTYDGHD